MVEVVVMMVHNLHYTSTKCSLTQVQDCPKMAVWCGKVLFPDFSTRRSNGDNSLLNTE